MLPRLSKSSAFFLYPYRSKVTVSSYHAPYMAVLGHPDPGVCGPSEVTPLSQEEQPDVAQPPWKSLQTWTVQTPKTTKDSLLFSLQESSSPALVQGGAWRKQKNSVHPDFSEICTECTPRSRWRVESSSSFFSAAEAIEAEYGYISVKHKDTVWFHVSLNGPQNDDNWFVWKTLILC